MFMRRFRFYVGLLGLFGVDGVSTGSGEEDTITSKVASDSLLASNPLPSWRLCMIVSGMETFGEGFLTAY